MEYLVVSQQRHINTMTGEGKELMTSTVQK